MPEDPFGVPLRLSDRFLPMILTVFAAVETLAAVVVTLFPPTGTKSIVGTIVGFCILGLFAVLLGRERDKRADTERAQLGHDAKRAKELAAAARVEARRAKEETSALRAEVGPLLAMAERWYPKALISLAKHLADGDRPWLHIAKAEIDRSTGQISLVIQNTGGMPAFDVRVEHWGEISKVLVSQVLPAASKEAQELMARIEAGKFFETDYDTRENRLKHYGGGRHEQKRQMVRNGESFPYTVSDPTPELIKQLGLEGPRQVRLVGKITYTDGRDELKAEYPFCYQPFSLRFSADDVKHYFFQCPDQDLNVSR